MDPIKVVKNAIINEQERSNDALQVSDKEDVKK